MASTESEVIDVPRPQKSVTFGLIILAFFMPWLALYLDGSSYPSIWFNLAAFFFLFPVGAVGAIIHAIVCLCRTDEHRKYSKPARRRLRYQNNYSAKPHTETKAVEPEPSPAPVKKTVTEPPPAPVTRAVNEGPAPVERAPTALPAPVQKAATEPPVVKSAATSSASVSSSDVEKETPPVAAPPPKKEDDPFRDPAHTMWKRFQGHGREKERHAQIGHPVLLETTYDEEQLMRNPKVTDLQAANYRYNAPSTQHYHSSSQDSRTSHVPTVSSVYSRPSNDLSYYNNNPEAAAPSTYEDISPPSSPELEQQYNSDLPRRYRSMRDVSPMDEARGATRGVSNIPVLRKAPAAIQTSEVKSGQKFWGGKVAPNSKVKWDEYSGEPTSSNAGRAGSVNPLAYAKDSLRPMGYQVSVSGPENKKKNISFTDRVGRFGARPQPTEPTHAPEPWSRATGRAEIARPLKDDESHLPLQFSRKPSTRKVEGLGLDMSNVVATRVPVEDDARPVANHQRSPDTHYEPIKPIVPLKVGRTSPLHDLASPVTPQNHGLGITTLNSYPSPVTPTTEKRTSPSVAINDDQSETSETESWEGGLTPKQSTVWNKPTEQTPEKDKEAPHSRFSWTTYNSATTYQHSPPPSPPQPMPALHPLAKGRVVTEPASGASSILNRRRPVPQADKIPDSPAPVRKPVPAARSPVATKVRTTALASPTSPRPDSTFSTSTTGTQKALPQPPTTLSASDHVSLLESQMEDLRVRRSNVYRLLNDLNNAAPSNPMLTDFKRARLVEQRKKAFEDELAEIKIKEHEIGLKLHRALRKREREDPNSGSALWIRRVTG